LSSNREYFKLLTEPLAVLLVCSITYLVLLKENRLGLITGVLLGFLVLVKVVFAYVVLALLFILVFFKYNSNKKEMVDGHVKMLLVAFLVNVPYLFYTYSLTGNFLCWANNGGKSIYWMASPYKYELGDCVSPNLKVINNHEIVDFDSNYIYKNHSTEYHSILALPIGIQDIEFKKKAINLILRHPTKFIANWFCSVSRLLFNRPNTFSIQHNRGNPFFFIEIPSALFLGVLFFFSLDFINNKYPREISFLYLFGLVYFVISSLSYSSFRQFYVITPVFFIIFTPILFKLVQLIKTNYFEIKLNEYEK
jgi:4-amino-4-deoxy-L-arabinose transferase-like glycosyltransferase